MSAIKDKYKEQLDSHGIAWEEGHHTEELILNADEVVKSPGIPNDAPLIVKLKAQGTPIISEIEFAGNRTKFISTGQHVRISCKHRCPDEYYAGSSGSLRSLYAKLY